jgi:TolB-like protein/tetratricopeptide (TPR) repeat protein
MVTSDAVPTAGSHTTAPPWDQLDVITALNAVLASEAFLPSLRSREFLAFVVTEALAGRGARLSERIVARRALGRPDTFDGRADSAVRVQATRVRSALAQYYSAAGANDALRIGLPTGTYCPVFTVADAVQAPAGVPLEAGLVLVRFGHSGGSSAADIAMTLVETLTQRLSVFSDLRVLGPTSTDASDARRIGVALGARFVLQGTVVVRDDDVRLTAHVTDALNGEVIWTETDTEDLASFAGFAVVDDWGTAVAAQLGDWTGVVHRRERSEPGEAVGTLDHPARMAYYAYQENPTVESISAAALALDRAIDAGTRTPSMLAMRGWICTAEMAHGATPGNDDDLVRAESLAREALGVDSRNAQAHIVLCNVAMIRGQWDIAAQHATTAAELAPFHPSTLMAAATALCLSGDWQRGPALIQESFRLNPRHPGSYHVLPALGRLLEDDDAGALAEASLVHAPGQLWGPLYRALALGGLGHLDQAVNEMDQVLEIDPTFLDDPGAYFRVGMRCSDKQLTVLLRHFDPFLTPARHDPAQAQAVPPQRAAEVAQPTTKA